MNYGHTTLEYVVYLRNVSLTYAMCRCPDLGSVTMLVHPGLPPLFGYLQMCESNLIARLPDEEDKENKLRLEAYGGNFLNDLGILGRETRVRLSNMMIS